MGKIDDVLLRPKHPYTQALIDAISEPDPDNLNREKNIRIKDSVEISSNEGCRFRGRCPYAIDKCKVEPELKTTEEDHAFACYVDLD
jgi:peptide/nickel transport system ATP-binding protein